jgi:gas vesicle protein
MMEETKEWGGSGSLLLFLAGGLVGAGVALLYAPLSGEETRQHIRIQAERARRKTRDLAENIKENIASLIDEVKETTDKIIEEGKELTKEKKAELLAAIEAGKKAMEEEREKIEKNQSMRNRK